MKFAHCRITDTAVPAIGSKITYLTAGALCCNSSAHFVAAVLSYALHHQDEEGLLLIHCFAEQGRTVNPNRALRATVCTSPSGNLVHFMKNQLWTKN